MPKWRIALLGLVAIVAAAALAFVVFIVLFITHRGDRPPVMNLHVGNRTDVTVTVTTDVWVAGPPEHKKTERGVVPPGQTVAMGGRCDLQD